MSIRVRAAFLLSLLPLSQLHAQDVVFTIDGLNTRHTISDSVYGANDLNLPGATVHRHGGNRHTGLNWENNASNAGSDYFHSSDSFLGSNAGIGNSQMPGALLQAWVNADRAAGLKTIITLPVAGYVAADMNGTVAPGETAPSPRWKEVIVDKPGPLSLNPNTADGVVYLEEMVNFLVANYGTTANGGVAAYSLDNEPALWPSTHPRIHPNPTGYAELVSRHTAAATMTTALDPSAQIYGPVLYGWEAHRNLQSAPDSSGFNNTYGTFTNYYLAQMKTASDTAGRRLLHHYDMHWYPEARGDNRIVFGNSPGTNNDIDARLQAPRSLWDSSYIETSWITQFTTNGQGVRLLPRLQESIDQYFPGTGLAITEYNYGASDHISGGVAVADVLGIFGRYQVAGCFWPLQADNSFVAAAFQLYRNYDGAGSAFGTTALDASASDNAKAAVHAARTGNGKLTVVAINRSRTLSRTATFQFTLPNDTSLGSLSACRLSSAGGAQVQTVSNPPTPATDNFADTLPAMSVTLYEIQLLGGFFAWQQDEFGGNASNPQIAGASADPDHDGLANLVEYETRRDPNRPETSGALAIALIQQGSTSSIQIQFQKRKNVNDVSLTLQNSQNLQPNSWSDLDLASLNPTVTSIDSKTELWTITISATGPPFFRLKASQ